MMLLFSAMFYQQTLLSPLSTFSLVFSSCVYTPLGTKQAIFFFSICYFLVTCPFCLYFLLFNLLSRYLFSFFMCSLIHVHLFLSFRIITSFSLSLHIFWAFPSLFSSNFVISMFHVHTS